MRILDLVKEDIKKLNEEDPYRVYQTPPPLPWQRQQRQQDLQRAQSITSFSPEERAKYFGLNPTGAPGTYVDPRNAQAMASFQQQAKSNPVYSQPSNVTPSQILGPVGNTVSTVNYRQQPPEVTPSQVIGPSTGTQIMPANAGAAASRIPLTQQQLAQQSAAVAPVSPQHFALATQGTQQGTSDPEAMKQLYRPVKQPSQNLPPSPLQSYQNQLDPSRASGTAAAIANPYHPASAYNPANAKQPSLLMPGSNSDDVTNVGRKKRVNAGFVPSISNLIKMEK